MCDLLDNEWSVAAECEEGEDDGYEWLLQIAPVVQPHQHRRADVLNLHTDIT